MDVRTMKHAAKLAEWSEKVQACRSSGLPVKEWCEQNNVCSKTYYTWERVYLAEVSKQLGIPEQLPVARTNQIVRVDPSQMPDEMEVVGAAPAVQTTLNAKITLRYQANLLLTSRDELCFPSSVLQPDDCASCHHRESILNQG